MCVGQRAREREGEYVCVGQRARERERVSMCVWDRERASERERERGEYVCNFPAF